MTPGRSVPTERGAVRGGTIRLPSGSVDVFKGIPYAAPPTGPLRWRPPQAAQRWSGTRDALAFGPDSPQAPNPRMRGAGMSEDCLHVNVWAPAGADALPVMVWVHGGGFVGGSGSDLRSDGALMASQGVVVVSFNYRAGLFGFLAHPALSRESEHGVSGNYGLLDQLAALRWVQENIARFGGDPSRVTVFGVSAGSASISLLLTSQQSRGLFRQAILHSHGAARPLSSLAEAEQAGTALGMDIEALRALPADAIFSKTALLTPKMRGLTTPRVLRPIRDGWILTEDERPAFLGGRLHAMPTIVGTNFDEGTSLTRSWPLETLAQYREIVDGNFGADAAQAALLYPAHTDGDVRRRVAEMFADTQFNYGSRLLARAMVKREPRTWRYLFTRRPPGQQDGPHHGDEVAYVFGNLNAVPGADAGDRAVSSAMTQAWVRFARSADPNGAGLPHWARFDAGADNHLVFGNTIEAGRAWRARQLDFLERFFDGKA